jgi:DNA-binding XRE family transcriptional regulator
MTFPEQLKSSRQQLSLSQAGLAALLDVSPRAIWQWEKGTLPHILTQEGVIGRLFKLMLLHRAPTIQATGCGKQCINEQ